MKLFNGLTKETQARSILLSMLMFMPVVPAILTKNKRHFDIAVGERIFGGMQDFDFAQI